MGSGSLEELTALLPVLRELNRATQRLAAAVPGPAHPFDAGTADGAARPTVDEALAEVNAAIDAYCAVAIEHSGIV